METVGLRGKHAAAAGDISLDLALKEGHKKQRPPRTLQQDYA